MFWMNHRSPSTTGSAPWKFSTPDVKTSSRPGAGSMATPASGGAPCLVVDQWSAMPVSAPTAWSLR